MPLEYKIHANHLTITDGCEFEDRESNIVQALTATGRDNTEITADMDGRNKRTSEWVYQASRSLFHANLVTVEEFYLHLACDVQLKCPKCAKVYSVTREDFLRALK